MGTQKVKNIEEKPAEKEEKSEKALEAKKENKKEKQGKAKIRGKKWQKSSLEIEKDKLYPLDEALDLLSKISYSKFDPSVEVHVKTNLKKKIAIRQTVDLPYGTGKEPKIAIFDEDLLFQIQKGKLDFDVLLARPADMPKLAKLARILGPKGLMPNPKSKTLTENPKEEIENIKKGQIEFKADAQGNIHQIIGKLSWDKKKLSENFKALIAATIQYNPISVTISSTMSPGIKIIFK